MQGGQYQDKVGGDISRMALKSLFENIKKGNIEYVMTETNKNNFDLPNIIDRDMQN